MAFWRSLCLAIVFTIAMHLIYFPQMFSDFLQQPPVVFHSDFLVRFRCPILVRLREPTVPSHSLPFRCHL